MDKERTITQFPHCDPRILHRKKECQYCDEHLDWQELREAWHINFTGGTIKTDEEGNQWLPCPSEVARPLNHINQWDGNVPFKGDQINTKSQVFPAGADIQHDSFSRHVYISKAKEPQPDCALCYDEYHSYNCLRPSHQKINQRVQDELKGEAARHDRRLAQQSLDYMEQAVTDARELLTELINIHAAIRRLLG